MKYTPYITILAMLLAAACAKENIVEDGQQGLPDDAVTFSASMASRQSDEAGPDTRTVYKDGDRINVEWAANDRIGIFCRFAEEVTAANVGYSTATAGKTATFTCFDDEAVSWEDMTSAHDFFAYYPYAETAEGVQADFHAVPVSLPSVQVYDEADPMGHLADGGFIYAKAEDQSKEMVGNGSVPLKFSHLFPVLEVRITADRFASIDKIVFRSKAETSLMSFEGGKVDIETGTLDLTAATGSPTISLEGSMQVLMGMPVSFHLLMSPGHAEEEFVIEAVINDKTVTLAERTAPAEGFTAGKAYYVDASMSIDESDAEPVTDLSANGTANTYYVTKAGTLYSFDATVKGNGEELYALEETSIEPKSLLVLWYTCLQTSAEPWAQSEPILISTLTLANGKAYFKTPETFVPGNVVIVALSKDLGYDDVQADPTTRVISNAEILWSWNLVVAKGYDPMAVENQYAKGGFTFMTRELGALIDLEDAYIDGKTNMIALAGTAGNTYQWGRKDPFPGIPDYRSGSINGFAGLWFTPVYTPIPALDRGTFGNSGKQAYNQILGNTVATVTLDAKSASYSTTAEYIGQMTKNPHLWYNRNGAFPGPDGANVWGNPQRADILGVKTIYDPCPPGYKVMSEAAWMTLTENLAPETLSVSDPGRGILLDETLYFPIKGYEAFRSTDASPSGGTSLGSGGGSSGLWSDGSNGGHYCFFQATSKTYIMTYCEDRAGINAFKGCGVRCIKESYSGVNTGTEGDDDLINLGKEEWN